MIKYISLILVLFGVVGHVRAAGDDVCDADGVCTKVRARPNILLLVSDDTGYGDLGVYGGGVGRGMATPHLDQLARDGMQFFSFYAQPSCTPGRAAMQTGRIPNRSGMTTVAFQGQGGGLPAAEWTIASVLSKAGYNTYFAGKWHLGEDLSAMPFNHGYDEMDNVILYHLNAYTYSWESWNPDMAAEQLAFFKDATTGRLSGKAGDDNYTIIGDVTEENIAELDMIMTDAALDKMETLNADAEDKPWMMSINFGKNHQPNLPSSRNTYPRSAAKSKYADCVCEMDYNVGRFLSKLHELEIEENTVVFYTVDNGAWQDVHPDAGYTPFRGTKGTVREGGVRVPAIARWTGQIAPGAHSHDIVGGLDFMATFASFAHTTLPELDRAEEPIIFDSIDMSNVLFNRAEGERRNEWHYFTEIELAPGAIRIGKFKAVFNLRGDNGAVAGSDMPGQQLGWRGQEAYVATVPHMYDLYQDPQERYDLFMNSYTEKTWTMVFFNEAMNTLIGTYEEYPPRPLQSETYSGPVSINRFRAIEKLKHIKDKIKRKAIELYS